MMTEGEHVLKMGFNFIFCAIAFALLKVYVFPEMIPLVSFGTIGVIYIIEGIWKIKR